MQMLHVRRNQHRPAPAAATDVEADAAARGQKTPWKNAEIIVEYCLSLLLREMILVLVEARPLAPETTRNPQIEIIIEAKIHTESYLPNYATPCKPRAKISLTVRGAGLHNPKYNLSY
jgi:hypothetical protein